jgi:uncharacterized membrane protein
MSEEPLYAESVNDDVSDDDKLWALLSYIFAPLVSIVVLLMEDKKNRPFIKYHAMQALALGIVIIVLNIVLAVTVVGLCVPALLWLAMIYWGVKAYQGEYVEIPLLTSLMKGQGWL